MKLPSFLAKERHAVPVRGELLLAMPAISNGMLDVHEDIILDTTHTGEIRILGHLTLGPNAIVKGSVQANSLHHQGQLEGSITAKEAVTLHGSAILKHSKIKANQIEVHPGSQLIDVNITTN